ncbi:MAG TPA: zinc-ribbon domain-containing protein [Kofleriaceae bacterium]|jgi:predicted Zn finger-like uncharacterized protein
MDVRCEKCQTEYELDEARLKPGGVTVKCTNCGHMFKIRKRTITNAGVPAVAPPQPQRRADSILGDLNDLDGPTTRDPKRSKPPTGPERQWLIRLENGEQKSCRELATLQQWIVGGLVTRESLISRSGKTWKRLGDIAELAQYFTVGDEARTIRSDRSARSQGRPTMPTNPQPPATRGTQLGLAGGPQAQGGTILPDDDEEEVRTTGNFSQRPVAPAPVAPPSARTPAMGSNTTAAATAKTELIPAGVAQVAAAIEAAPVRRPPTQPPPPPAKKLPAPPPPIETSGPAPSAIPPIPTGNRATAAWASDEVKAAAATGPVFGGKIGPVADEPAFAGRVRIQPTGEGGFETGKVRALDDDDDLLPPRRSSRAGTIVTVMALLVLGAAAGVVYVVAFRHKTPATTPTGSGSDGSGSAIAATPPDAAVVLPDVAVAPPPSPFDAAKTELYADVEARLKTAAAGLATATDPDSLAWRAHLLAQVAQDEDDRAGLIADRAAANTLRTDAKTVTLDAAQAAQRAFKGAPENAGANIAMGEVLRLQGKHASDSKRYFDAAQAQIAAKGDKDWPRELALATALEIARDAKPADAQAAFAAIDAGAGAMEATGDVRARFHVALALLGQGKAAEAKPLVDQILAAQPEHVGAKALAAKLATMVSTTDQMPPEDHHATVTPVPGPPPVPVPVPVPVPSGGDSYDALVTRANTAAETNCTKAMDLYNKALEEKPNGVEALSGMGYCHIDAKQFSSAFSKFRAALAVSPKFEPALYGIAEAYQQQGRREQAIEQFKAYLEVYPDSTKAKRQLQILGADATPPQGSGGSGSAPTPPTPTPTPPTPTPPTPEQPQKAPPGPTTDPATVPTPAPAPSSGPTTEPSGN